MSDQNPSNLNPNNGSGHVEKLGGLDTYVSGSANSKLAVLLVSHVLGYESPNLRKLADKVAQVGFYAVVPDFFRGDPYNPANQDRQIPIWIKDHGQEKGFEDSKPVVEALKNKGITAVGVAGFCWGAVVLLHPTHVTVDDIKEVKVPISVLGAEFDQVSPPELVKQFEEILSSKPEVKSFVKIFPRVKHGWTVRYDVNDPAEVQVAEEAHKDMMDWLIEHVK